MDRQVDGFWMPRNQYVEKAIVRMGDLVWKSFEYPTRGLADLVENPTLEVDGKTGSAFDLLEELDSQETLKVRMYQKGAGVWRVGSS